MNRYYKMVGVSFSAKVKNPYRDYYNPKVVCLLPM
jgi:hypothetical protein